MGYPSTISSIFTIIPGMTVRLISLAEKAAKALEQYSFVRVISHNDADGITAGGIMSSALFRSNIIFRTSIVSAFNQNVVDSIDSYGDDSAVVFCDMGSGQPELVNQVKDDVFIIDHHQVIGDHTAKVHVNPHVVGIDGVTVLSASGTAYFVARAMGDNVDLAGLALTGAVGDKQRMEGPNLEILQQARNAGVISVKKGLRIRDGPADEVLLTLAEPYLDIAGDREATNRFLEEVAVSGNIQDMGTEDIRKLASAMALNIAGRADPSVIQSIVGDVLILNREVVSNIYSLEWMLNCCGKMDLPALGLALCMRDASVLDEAARISSKYQHNLIEQVKAGEKLIREMNNIRYVALEDASGTGNIAGTLIRYVCPDKPFITLNIVKDIVKVSARGTRRLVDKGLDLGLAMREAAAGVGGQGGGHNIASGASIPPPAIDEFLGAVNRIIGGQLG
jgi:single-stranded-DNA-specific exonuclease